MKNEESVEIKAVTRNQPETPSLGRASPAISPTKQPGDDAAEVQGSGESGVVPNLLGAFNEAAAAAAEAAATKIQAAARGRQARTAAEAEAAATKIQAAARGRQARTAAAEAAATKIQAAARGRQARTAAAALKVRSIVNKIESTGVRYKAACQMVAVMPQEAAFVIEANDILGFEIHPVAIVEELLKQLQEQLDNEELSVIDYLDKKAELSLLGRKLDEDKDEATEGAMLRMSFPDTPHGREKKEKFLPRYNEYKKIVGSFMEVITAKKEVLYKKLDENPLESHEVENFYKQVIGYMKRTADLFKPYGSAGNLIERMEKSAKTTVELLRDPEAIIDHLLDNGYIRKKLLNGSDGRLRDVERIRVELEGKTLTGLRLKSFLVEKVEHYNNHGRAASLPTMIPGSPFTSEGKKSACETLLKNIGSELKNIGSKESIGEVLRRLGEDDFAAINDGELKEGIKEIIPYEFEKLREEAKAAAAAAAAAAALATYETFMDSGKCQSLDALKQAGIFAGQYFAHGEAYKGENPLISVLAFLSPIEFVESVLGEDKVNASVKFSDTLFAFGKIESFAEHGKRFAHDAIISGEDIEHVRKVTERIGEYNDILCSTLKNRALNEGEIDKAYGFLTYYYQFVFDFLKYNGLITARESENLLNKFEYVVNRTKEILYVPENAFSEMVKEMSLPALSKGGQLSDDIDRHVASVSPQDPSEEAVRANEIEELISKEELSREQNKVRWALTTANKKLSKANEKLKNAQNKLTPAQKLAGGIGQRLKVAKRTGYSISGLGLLTGVAKTAVFFVSHAALHIGAAALLTVGGPVAWAGAAVAGMACAATLIGRKVGNKQIEKIKKPQEKVVEEAQKEVDKAQKEVAVAVAQTERLAAQSRRKIGVLPCKKHTCSTRHGDVRYATTTTVIRGPRSRSVITVTPQLTSLFSSISTKDSTGLDLAKSGVFNEPDEPERPAPSP